MKIHDGVSKNVHLNKQNKQICINTHKFLASDTDAVAVRKTHWRRLDCMLSPKSTEQSNDKDEEQIFQTTQHKQQK